MTILRGGSSGRIIRCEKFDRGIFTIPARGRAQAAISDGGLNGFGLRTVNIFALSPERGIAVQFAPCAGWAALFCQVLSPGESYWLNDAAQADAVIACDHAGRQVSASVDNVGIVSGSRRSLLISKHK